MTGASGEPAGTTAAERLSARDRWSADPECGLPEQVPVVASRTRAESRPHVPVISPLLQREPSAEKRPTPPKPHAWTPRPGAEDLLCAVIELSVIEGRFGHCVPAEKGRLTNHRAVSRRAQQRTRRHDGRRSARTVAGMVATDDHVAVVAPVFEMRFPVGRRDAAVDH